MTKSWRVIVSYEDVKVGEIEFEKERHIEVFLCQFTKMSNYEKWQTEVLEIEEIKEKD